MDTETITFGKHDRDSGGSAVQIARLSERIRSLTEHLKTHRKDFSTRRGLFVLIGRRRRLIRYLMSQDSERCQEVLSKYKIRFAKTKA